ncbi:chemotaxis protein CheW [Candidatus Acidulodesulfobacterium sp. H_13]|uniref:chemotaxis protein CheW n=1 Tax=Candidatus Acidulodesulfobacterium sp. H_13 TaxID=3395470 RepID=UPI003AF99CEC
MDDDIKQDPINIFTFKLDDGIYGIDILLVREILDYKKITKVPQSLDFMLGVINLRGNVVPVIDLKLKLDIGKTDITIDTCIVIAEVVMKGEPTVIGALADSVYEVMDIESSNVEEAPKIGLNINNKFIRGMAKKDNDFVIILDVEKVFSDEELKVINDSQNQETSNPQEDQDNI